MRWPRLRPAAGIMRGAYRQHNLPRRLFAGAPWPLWVQLENTGSAVWRRHAPGGHDVKLAVSLDGRLQTALYLSRDEVRPGERVLLSVRLDVPSDPGTHRFSFDLVEHDVAFFSQRGIAPLEVEVETVAGPPGAERAFRTHDDFFSPSQLHPGRPEAPFPIVVEQAQGCWLTDAEGRRYLDYVMGDRKSVV